MAIKVLVISNYREYHTVRPEAETFIGLAKLGFEITVMTYGDSKYVEDFERPGSGLSIFILKKNLIERK